jgi:hypothetical protein
MKRNFIVALATCVFAVSAAGTMWAQGSNDPAKKIVGMWRLVKTEQKMPDGSTRPNPVYGAKGKGFIVYTDTGRMCATLADSTIPNWKVYGKATEAEARNAVDHFHAYCGAYTLNAKDSYVIHHVEMDNIPNDIGIDRKRNFKFSGNLLMLSPDPPPAGVVAYTLTWERIEK